MSAKGFVEISGELQNSQKFHFKANNGTPYPYYSLIPLP